jgi:hypothetical protein
VRFVHRSVVVDVVRAEGLVSLLHGARR